MNHFILYRKKHRKEQPYLSSSFKERLVLLELKMMLNAVKEMLYDLYIFYLT